MMNKKTQSKRIGNKLKPVNINKANTNGGKKFELKLKKIFIPSINSIKKDENKLIISLPEKNADKEDEKEQLENQESADFSVSMSRAGDFRAPVIISNNAEQTSDDLELSVADAPSVSSTKDINYTSKAGDGSYSGSSDYFNEKSIKYSSDNTDTRPILDLSATAPRQEIFNPFSSNRGGAGWGGGDVARQIEDFMKQEDRVRREREDRSRPGFHQKRRRTEVA